MKCAGTMKDKGGKEFSSAWHDIMDRQNGKRMRKLREANLRPERVKKSERRRLADRGNRA